MSKKVYEITWIAEAQFTATVELTDHQLAAIKKNMMNSNSFGGNDPKGAAIISFLRKNSELDFHLHETDAEDVRIEIAKSPYND